LGALPPFLDERSGGWRPVDLGDFAIRDYDSLDEDPAEFLLPYWGGHRDRLGQGEQAGSVGIERADAVVIG
jgi:hypothetical protein